MTARRFAAVLCLALAASAAAAAPERDPPSVELPEGARVVPGRPLAVRVPGGAERIRAPGTPWALPLDPRGETFVLQMPAAVASPLDVTVERAGEARVRVSVPVAVGPLVALEPSEAFFEPLTMPPDPGLFAVLAEVSAAAPHLGRADAILLLVVAVAEVVLVGVLAFRSDRGWRRAAWLCGPPVAAAAYLVALAPLTAPLRAATLWISGEGSSEFVRIEALRDGDGVLRAAEGAVGPASVVRFAPDDRTVEDLEAGRDVRLRLRAGESRVVGWQVDRQEPVLVAPLSAPTEVATGEALDAWLAERGLRARWARFGDGRRARPGSADVRVLPVLTVAVEPLPAK